MSALVIERSRGILRVAGRDPAGMIQGLATADIAGVTPAQGVYTAFLTPKGKMVADARVVLVDAEAPALLLDTAPDALPHLVDHIARYVPPLFARAEDVTDDWAVIGLYGPDADEVAGALPAVDAVVGAESDDAAAEGSGPEAAPPAAPESVVGIDGGFRMRTLVTGDAGWDVFVRPDRKDDVVAALLGAGGRPGDPDSLEALRIAAGVPRWGRELTADTIPLEAGLLERAISQTKGCYTGQEVIVRILHRGHVNRELRRLELTAPVDPGTELYEEGLDKVRGVVTSVAENDAGVIGLGYVRREVEPPAELRAGSPAGDPVRVTSLD